MDRREAIVWHSAKFNRDEGYFFRTNRTTRSRKFDILTAMRAAPRAYFPTTLFFCFDSQRRNQTTFSLFLFYFFFFRRARVKLPDASSPVIYLFPREQLFAKPASMKCVSLAPLTRHFADREFRVGGCNEIPTRPIDHRNARW